MDYGSVPKNKMLGVVDQATNSAQCCPDVVFYVGFALEDLHRALAWLMFSHQLTGDPGYAEMIGAVYEILEEANEEEDVHLSPEPEGKM